MVRDVVESELDWNAILDDASRPTRPACLITGYEYLMRNQNAMRIVAAHGMFGLDVLILDEAHRLKEPTTQTTMMVYGALCAGGPGSLVGMAKRTLLLTATPQLNHPGEWYPHLNALTPERLSMRSYDAFTQRYCTWTTRTITMPERPGQSRPQTKQIAAIDGANRDADPGPGAAPARLLAAPQDRRRARARSRRPRSTLRTIEPELCDATLLKEVENSD